MKTKIEKLDAEIYQRDKYAARATDIVFEKVGGPDKLAAMFITHVLSPTPLESHVFATLLYKTPLYVATKDETLWYVENGVISNRGKL